MQYREMARNKITVDNINNAESSSSENAIQLIEDYVLEGKINRTKNLLNVKMLHSFSDCGQKLKAYLEKLLGERERRKRRVQVEKAEPGTPSSVEGSENIGREDFSWTPGNKRNAGYVDNSGPKSVSLSPLSHNSFARNGNHSLTTYSKRPRVYNFSSREEDSSQGINKTSKCYTSAYFLREENARWHSDEKESLSLTKQGQTKKKVAKLIDLDEEDDKQQKQPCLDKMSEKWMKDTKVYYPARNDPDSVEICYSDMECLDPFSYLSSPIMNFYIRYLQRPESLKPTQRNSYHFFNTYFYSKLDEALCDQRLQENGDSIVKLRRWLKGVNIFEKAYIFLPIYYSLHWSLAIICFPAKEDKSAPFVLHLDSLGLHTSCIIFRNIQSFLKIEWEHLNQTGLPEHIPIEDNIWITLINRIENRKIQVPQQDNTYDCGLFVLFFIERFIKDAPARIRKEDLNMFGRKWFRPAEASQLRSSIKCLLEKHFEDTRNAR